jgi:hypothetical protein
MTARGGDENDQQSSGGCRHSIIVLFAGLSGPR